MSYEFFQERVKSLLIRAGGNIGVSFSHDDGRHYAKCSDGTTIIGNSECSRVMVKWGSGHAAHANI